MKKLFLRPDGTFRILQVSDAQDMHFVRKTMLTMLDAAYEALEPDLVVFTGDNILGNHLCDRRFGSRTADLSITEETRRMKKALDYILSQPQSRSIPFSMVFGNHDDRNRLGKPLQFSLWESYSCFQPGEGPLDCRELPVYAPDSGKRALTLWLMDTARYDRRTDACEETVLPETVRHFERRNRELVCQNAEQPALVFAHIPLPGICRLFLENIKGVPYNGKYYQLDPAKASGTYHTYPAVVSDDSGLSEVLQRTKNVQAVISGHDHTNCFVGKTGHLQWIQTSCASFRCYGSPDLRGVRLLEWNNQKKMLTGTNFYSYEALCGHGLPQTLRYFWDADEYEKMKATLLTAGAITAASAFAALIGKHGVHRRGWD